MTAVMVYSHGLIYCSACVPGDMDAAAVEEAVNRQNPTEIDSRWSIAPEPFRGGQTNPCVCNDEPGRQHWLLRC